MRAFKFRSASQVAFALDIIINKRLFCADWKTLNDPLEGMFAYNYLSRDEEDVREQVMQIVEQKQGLKVCSLSKTFDSHLLWAHYAGGFDGMAIEMELPEEHPSVKDVIYRGVYAMPILPTKLRMAEDGRQKPCYHIGMMGSLGRTAFGLGDASSTDRPKQPYSSEESPYALQH